MTKMRSSPKFRSQSRDNGVCKVPENVLKTHCKQLSLKCIRKDSTIVIEPTARWILAAISITSRNIKLDNLLKLYASNINSFYLAGREMGWCLKTYGISKNRNRFIRCSLETIQQLFEGWVKRANSVYDDFYLLPSAGSYFLYFSHHDEILLYVLESARVISRGKQ